MLAHNAPGAPILDTAKGATLSMKARLARAVCPLCKRRVLLYSRAGETITRSTHHDDKQGKACPQSAKRVAPRSIQGDSVLLVIWVVSADDAAGLAALRQSKHGK